MAKFCTSCGTPCADEASFCTACGKPLNAPSAPQEPQYQAQPQAPVQPQAPIQPQAPVQSAPAAQQKPLDMVVGYTRKYLKIIIAVVAAFALLAGILNLFGLYNVSVTTSFNGEKQTSVGGSLGDLRSSSTSMEEIPLYIISTFLMGLVGLASAVLLGGAAYILFSNKELVISNKQFKSRQLFSIGSIVLGAGSLLSLLMGLFGGTYSESVMGFSIKAVFNVNWTYWVAVILGVLLVVVDKVFFKEDASPLQ